MMLFMTIFIALSYFAWFLVQSITLFLFAHSVVNAQTALIMEEIASLVLVLCQ